MTELEQQLEKLRPTIVRMGGNGTCGEDIYQEVAVACFERSLCNCTDNLILSIARHKRIDAYRRESLRQSLPLMDTDLAPLPAEFCVDELLSTLEPKDRQIVHGRFWEGKTFVEIASELRCPESSVRTKWSRLRNRLRTEYGSQFYIGWA